MIGDNGGVPISVTLQPIPEKLITGSLVYQLNADFVEVVLKAFSMLDDLSNRFRVLQDEAIGVRDFVPELERTCRVAAGAYKKTHTTLLHELAQFLFYYQHGEKHEDHCDKGRHCLFISGDRILEEATRIYDQQLDPDYEDPDISQQYPASLAGLEIEVSRFLYFVSDIRSVRESMQDQVNDASSAAIENSAYLSCIEDVCRALRTQNTIRLFVMLPTAGGTSQPDLTAIQYFALIRKYPAYFKDAANPPYMVYAEDLTELDRRLSMDESVFSELEDPSLVVGTIDDDGYLTWEQVPPRARSIALFQQYRKPTGYVTHSTNLFHIPC